jgi:primosomal protein N' (replication factor Y)
VVPDVPAIRRRFDYTVPPALDAAVHLGSRVRVELHGRRVGAWVVEDDVEPTPGVSPKPVAASSGEGPPPSVLELAEWAAWRWAGPLSSFLGTASPERVVRRSPGTPAGAATGARARRDGTSPSALAPSPGGGSVGLVAEALTAPGGCSVVRLANQLGPEGLLVLTPSHARAGQLATRLARAGLPAALVPGEWEAAASGRRLVVGTRAAAWSPQPELRAAVVLDAHDEAYREERAPTWSAVDVTVERGRRDGAPVLLVSPCPPVTLTEGRPLVRTDRAVERRGWPVVEVVDRTGDDPRTGLFSERLVAAVRESTSRPGGRAVCILNRTGRVRMLACGHCGALARCTRCGGPVAQVATGEGLHCRRCGEERPAVCAVCDSTRLKALRIGVTRATEELGALIGVAAVEVSGPSGPGHPVTAPLVVGTEAALHRVDGADLVAFLDLDQHLLAPRFGAGEETMALLARAGRLVGPRSGGGRVLVQTRIPDHEVLTAVTRADPGILGEAERRLRLQLALPPFGALALLAGPGSVEFATGLDDLGTVGVSPLESERWMVRAPDAAALADALAAVPRPVTRLRVEVDPTAL